MSHPEFPTQRPRRLRNRTVLRDALADVHLTTNDLILPLFVGDLPAPNPVSSMPGVFQWPVKQAVEYIHKLTQESGLTQFILFGITPDNQKDPSGTFAAKPEAPVNRVLAAVRDLNLPVVMYADLCLCEYTDHGHCGLVHHDTQHPEHFSVLNDATLDILARTAIAQAQAGAHFVAPSGMMDGMVRAIRSALDKSNFVDTGIMSYSVKYASGFYGPFREAGQGGMKFGDRKGYQMDYRRSREWQTELEADIAQGADIVMVKPAVPYLDVLYQMRQATSLPLAAYHVSGEYAMLHAAAQKGWLDLRQTALETTFGIKRAGADLILTYFAPQLAQWLQEKH